MPRGRRLTDYTAFDEVVVRRLTDGCSPGGKVTAADRGEVTRRLAARGYSDGQIAYPLGLTRRSVLRIRIRLGIPAALTPRQNHYHLMHDAPTRPSAKG